MHPNFAAALQAGNHLQLAGHASDGCGQIIFETGICKKNPFLLILSPVAEQHNWSLWIADTA